MIDMWTFALFMSDVAPSIEAIGGRFFLDRFGRGREGLLEEIKKYADILEAQRWINMVPIDDFLDGVVSDWSIDDPAIQKIVDVYSKSWMSALRSKYGDVENVSVELLRDADNRDVIIRLTQS
jgi:hypothetical protein